VFVCVCSRDAIQLGGGAVVLGFFEEQKDIFSNLIGQIRFFFTMAVKYFYVENCS